MKTPFLFNQKSDDHKVPSPLCFRAKTCFFSSRSHTAFPTDANIFLTAKETAETSPCHNPGKRSSIMSKKSGLQFLAGHCRIIFSFFFNYIDLFGSNASSSLATAVRKLAPIEPSTIL